MRSCSIDHVLVWDVVIFIGAGLLSDLGSAVSLIKMLQARPRASLPLQVMIYFDQLYCIFYFIIAFILYIYKGYTLTYPRNAIGAEIVGVFFFAFYQYIRLFVGSG